MKEYAEDTYGYKRDIATALPQLLAVSVKNLLLVAYGSTLGIATIIIPAVTEGGTDDLQLNKNEISWLSSIALICVPLGCLISGVLTDYFGRRTVMRMCTLPFILAWIIFYFANSVQLLYLASVITGFTGGLLEAPVLTYVAEITQPYLRGMLSATSSLCVIIGIFTQFFFGIFFTWRVTALVDIIFPLISLTALFFVPESPHWLIANGKFGEAKKSLRWLRGWTTDQAVQNEYNDLFKLIRNEAEVSRNTENSPSRKTIATMVKVYGNRSFFEPLFLVSLVFFLGHFCGMTSLQTYAVFIFEKLHAPIDKYYATLILGIVQIVGAMLCVSLVHFTGKRILMFISTIGTAICCFVVGTYAYLLIENEGTVAMGSALVNFTNTSTITTGFTNDHNSYEWIPLTFLIGLALLSHLGIRLLPWILIGEVFTTETRSKASGLASGVGYIFGFLTNKIYLSMVSNLTFAGTYWLYGSVIIIGFIILTVLLPETEGKMLSEIQDHFSGKKKLSNKVARSRKTEDGKNNKVGIDNNAFPMETIDL